MAKNRTDKCCYKSRYNNSYITPAQYITELICEKHAYLEYKDLPREFWKIKKWADKFKYQIKYANNLVKKYPHQAIVKALFDPRSRSIYSLANPVLKDIISDYVQSMNDDKRIDQNRFVNANETYENKSYKSSVLGRIKEIEDEV